MQRHAIGIVQHRITQRWQPWVYAEDDKTISLAFLSSHRSRSLAHLVTQIFLQASQTGQPVDLKAMLAHNDDNDVPDPLPQGQQQKLLLTIQAALPASEALIFLDLPLSP